MRRTHPSTGRARRARRSAASLVRFPRHGLTLACLAAGVTGSALHAPAPAPRIAMRPVAAVVRTVKTAARVVDAAPALAVMGAGPHAEAALPAGEGQLRAQLHWLPVSVGARKLATLDVPSRLRLARAAAEQAGLGAVGLDFRDLYGVIQAETSWVPRTGMGRNGVASHGLAQLEPATARALGVRNPDDAVEAVQAAARLLREAAVWSARRIAGLHLSAAEHARRLREGISVYYNLSTRARERWTGQATDPLPVETLRHIRNVRAGALEAQRLESGHPVDVQALAAAVAADPPLPRLPAPHGRRTALARAEPLHPLGTIAWSGRPDEEHVVWSNGSVTRRTDPVSGRTRVHWSSAAPRG